MIGLFEILLNEIKSPYIVVGAIDDELNVIQSNNIDSHERLISNNPSWSNRSICHWRFNANTQTVFWYCVPTEKMKHAVVDLLKVKYPHYHATRHIKLDSNDYKSYQKGQMTAHGLDEVCEDAKLV